jgi:hypothetical protein
MADLCRELLDFTGDNCVLFQSASLEHFLCVPEILKRSKQYIEVIEVGKNGTILS